MQSLGTRFNGNSQEVVEYARKYGYLPAMQQYKVGTCSAMVRFLDEKAPGEKFLPYKSNPDDFSSPDAFDKLVEAMLRKCSEMEQRYQDKCVQVEKLKVELDYYKATGRNNSALVESLREYCQPSEG